MKKTYTFLSLVLVAIVAIGISACKKKPIACMSVETTNLFDSIKVGEPVFFTSCSENADRLEWNLGDGSPKYTNATTHHAYDSPGMFNVTLKVWNDNDDNDDEIQRQIIVFP